MGSFYTCAMWVRGLNVTFKEADLTCFESAVTLKEVVPFDLLLRRGSHESIHIEAIV